MAMRFLGAVAAFFLLTSPAPLTAQSGRVVAIGDIHGAYDEFIVLLKRAGLVKDQLKWSGGRTTLVQTGDTTDRGAGTRQVLDLVMRLEREAKAAGGQVVTLLGNHEVMNLIGDWRDVTPEICATFATPQSEARRAEAWTRYQQLEPTLTAEGAKPAVYQQSREEWMQAHPPGCLEYRDAMGPNGAYGKWLRGKPIAAQVNDTLFMHAGINPSRPAPRSLGMVVDQARDEIKRMDAYRKRLVDRKLALPSFTLQQVLDVSVAELQQATAALAAAKAEGAAPPRLDLPTLREAQAMLDLVTWSLVDPEGPLWFRGYAQWDEATTAAQVTAFLDQMKLTRIVVGHTVMGDHRINTRYGGRVVLIDTGMLHRVYNGTPSALEITGGATKAIYPDGETALPATAATPPPAVPQRSPRQN